MNVLYTRVFQKDFQRLSKEIRVQAEKQLAIFANNPRHPSLRIKRIHAAGEHRWEGRITRGYRFTFDWEGETVILRRIGTHEVIDREVRA